MANKPLTSVVEIIKIWNSASIKDKDVLKKLGMTKEMFISKFKESNTMKSRCRNIRTSIVNLEALDKAAKKAAPAKAPEKETKAEATKTAPKAKASKEVKATASEAAPEEVSLKNFSNEELATQIMEGEGEKVVYMKRPNGTEKAFRWNTVEDLEMKIALFSRDQKIFNTQPYLNGSPIPTNRIKDGDHITIKTKEVGASN